ncbi:response regulator transcription factor [Smaragdicoccus niigatensis]|uniref:response regulator transcription factor n=1 Tax=Smaragdicoccus niigatensis TaxID=359359 RepID=UPI0003776414|nr:response regulator transcription factor [Smaragdicoccus niigatensis]
MTIRVLLADDHVVVREGLCALLGSIDGIEVVATASTDAEAIRNAVVEKPDVAVLDVSMPDHGGLHAAREIRRRAPEVGILMLTMHDDDETVREALAAGARGYLLKGADQKQVVRAIETVAAGDAVFGGSIAGQVIGTSGRRPRAADYPFPSLSAREREVLALLASGLPTGAIADRLTVSRKTISNHLSSIFPKLGVGTRTEAALRARRAGIGD